MPYLGGQGRPNNRSYIRIRCDGWRKHLVERLLGQQDVVQNEVVDPCRQETLDGIVRRFHNRLPFYVERGVQQHGNPGDRFELAQQGVQPLIVLLANGLNARCAVNVHDRGDSVSPCGADALGHQHERGVLVSLENLLGPLGKHDGREGPECLPMFDPLVQSVLHFDRTRVRQDAAVAKRARAEFGAALKPTEYVAFGKQFCCFAAYVLALSTVRL